MNGDFFALLPKNNFAQIGPKATCPEPVLQLQATTVFAFHCKDGVIITGDHRATAGNIIFSDKTEKILELDSHSLMAIAGVPGDGVSRWRGRCKRVSSFIGATSSSR